MAVLSRGRQVRRRMDKNPKRKSKEPETSILPGRDISPETLLYNYIDITSLRKKLPIQTNGASSIPATSIIHFVLADTSLEFLKWIFSRPRVVKLILLIVDLTKKD